MLRSSQQIRELAEERLRLFRTDLPTVASAVMYQRHIREPAPVALTNAGIEELFRLFAQEWGIDVGSLRLVGSAATGFSIKPSRRWQFFDQTASDLDVAVTDRDYFDDIWQEVHEYVRKGGFWHQQAEFKKHLYNGWIRPDVLPGIHGQQWFDFFRSIQSRRIFGWARVRAAFYPSDYFLEAYQCTGIDGCREVGVS